MKSNNYKPIAKRLFLLIPGIRRLLESLQNTSKVKSLRKELIKAHEQLVVKSNLVKQRNKQLNRTRKKLASLINQQNATRVFMSQLMRGPILCETSVSAFVDYHTAQPSFIMSVAFNMMSDPQSERAGRLMMIKLQFKRMIYSHVVDLVADYPTELVARHCFGEAAFSLATKGAVGVDTLVYNLVALHRSEGRWAGDERFIWDCKTGFEACILANIPDALDSLLEISPSADDDGVGENYIRTHRQAVKWRADVRIQVSNLIRKDATMIGLLGYRSPLMSSTNLGDYVQTIAMIGLIAPYLPTDTVVHDGGQDVIHRVLGMVGGRESIPTNRPIDMVWIDRDDPTTTPQGGPVWLPINGWFMHAKSQGNYDFPFADNVRPIFIGMHINQGEILTSDVISYLKKYEPIGARDYHTAELLMANGVDSFFSGCATLSLGGIFGRKSADDRTGRYYAAYRGKQTDPKGYELRIHLYPDMPTCSRDHGIEAAWSLLEEYASATEVITPLLHCFLPCRALGTPVKFTHAQLIRDTRFEGLIDISEDDRIKLTNAMRENVAVIMKLVVDGADENWIYQVWRERNASRVTAIRNRMREKSGNLPSIVQNIGMDWCKNLDRKTLRNGIFGEQPKRDESFTDISFCYDANFVRIVYATIRSLITNTQANVRLNLLTRDVCEIEILRLSKTFPDTDFVWIDMTEVTFEELNLLSHTTVSTMDRLFLPYLLDYADRVLYLDVDMAILGDIADLATLDLQGRMLGARRSIYHTWSSGFGLCSLIEKNLLPAQIPQFRREFTYAQFMNYKTFNAGMLLMDLGQLRNLNFTDKMLTIVQRYDINDQYAINLFAAGNFVEIEPKWNHFATQEMVLDPKIVHYTGIVKPWHHEYCPKAEKWRQYIVSSDGIIRTSALEQSYYK